ncbi:hypothetical protein [Microbacterium sp. 11MF]|uniref:hypothetical protein n=1 Tax=Microbacterium sp. 11MF TaxID=1169146 RepID=UPI0003A1C56C|nr:hypothetical protein [Microbacterium sp. 11MF]
MTHIYNPPAIKEVHGVAYYYDEDEHPEYVEINCQTDGPLPNRGDLVVTFSVATHERTEICKLIATFKGDGDRTVSLEVPGRPTRDVNSAVSLEAHAYAFTLELPASLFPFDREDRRVLRITARSEASTGRISETAGRFYVQP